jgi:hypothetical protein
VPITTSVGTAPFAESRLRALSRRADRERPRTAESTRLRSRERITELGGRPLLQWVRSVVDRGAEG